MCNTEVFSNSYEDLKFSTAISSQSLSKMIPEMCVAIV